MGKKKIFFFRKKNISLIKKWKNRVTGNGSSAGGIFVDHSDVTDRRRSGWRRDVKPAEEL